MRIQKWILVSLSATLIVAVAGCQSIGYYKQAFSGQMQMLSNQQPIQGLIAAPDTSPKLKEKFQLVLALRDFAGKELHLPTGGHYLSYVDLQRSNAVWNVYAAPELSLKPKSWWFPIVGSVTYRGYFSEEAAKKYATKIRKKGFDVYVGGVDAYSTLGWFKDPVLNTFIEDSERRLASLIFHELAHQRVFISGDTEFNEAFATAVAEVGLHRWLMAQSDSDGLKKYEAERERKKQFVELIKQTRYRLEAVYVGAESQKARAEKETILRELREEYKKLKEEWGGSTAYDEWFAGPLNNAQLSTVSTYYELVPAFHQLIQENDGDLGKFFAQMKSFTRMSKPARHLTLAEAKGRFAKQLIAARDSAKPTASLPMSAGDARP